MKILALWLLLLPWAAQAVELEITTTPHEEYGGVKFTGSTNLPDNARFMVLLERVNYKDEDTVTVKDGRYETKLFRGPDNRSVRGEYTVTIFARFDDRWQYESLLPVLKTYRSPLISGDRLAARTTITFAGSNRPPSQPSTTDQAKPRLPPSPSTRNRSAPSQEECDSLPASAGMTEWVGASSCEKTQSAAAWVRILMRRDNRPIDSQSVFLMALSVVACMNQVGVIDGSFKATDIASMCYVQLR